MSFTQEQISQMDLKSLNKAMNDPKVVADKQTLRLLAVRASELMQETYDKEAALDSQINRVIPPSTEQLAAEATAMVETPTVVPPARVAVPVANSWEAEDAVLKAQGVTVNRDDNGVPTRYSQEYQVRDEDGTPIGRPTYLSARTLAEFLAKKDEAHISATRAFYRLKKQKLTFKQEKTTLLTPEQISEAARIALEEKDPSKVTDVINATIESAFEKRERELREKELRAEGAAITNNFLRDHLHDYKPCDANNAALIGYLKEHNMEFSRDNMEAAFIDLMSQGSLVKVETPFIAKHVTEVANPTTVTTSAASVTPAIPATEGPAVVPVSTAPAQSTAPSQPVVEATAPMSAAAPNVQLAARRPGVNGSLPPGTLSAQRPGTPDPALSRKEFLQTVRKMDPKVMRAKLKNDPQFVQQLTAYGIRIQ
jgi:hypothetical protein